MLCCIVLCCCYVCVVCFVVVVVFCSCSCSCSCVGVVSLVDQEDEQMGVQVNKEEGNTQPFLVSV